MSAPDFAGYLVTMAYVTLYVAGPPLAVAAVVGFVIAMFQGVTSIQDQSLPLTVKIIAVMALLIAFGAALGQPLLALMDEVLRVFPAATRR